VLADKLAACTPVERYRGYYGHSPTLRPDGTIDPRDDPCPPHGEPMDTGLGRQLMQAVRHTPSGVALCEEKHRERRSKRAESKIGLTGLTTVFDPETQPASNNDDDGPEDGEWDPQYDRTYPAEIGVSLFSVDSDIVRAAQLSVQARLDTHKGAQPTRQTGAWEPPDQTDSMDLMVRGWEARSAAPDGVPDSVARMSDMRSCATIRTLAGGEGQQTTTLCTPWNKRRYIPGMMLDTCSSINLIHIAHVRALTGTDGQGPRVRQTNLCIRGSTGIAPAYGEIWPGEVDVVLNYGTKHAIMVRPHWYVTDNPDLKRHPLLGMPFLQAVGASIHMWPQGFQGSTSAAHNPGYGALEFCTRVEQRDMVTKMSIPLITSDSHPDPGREDGWRLLIPHRSEGSGDNHSQ